jgi:hypothetical protein
MDLKSVLALQFDDSTNLGQTFTSSSSVQIQSNLVNARTSVGGESELDEFVLGALQSKILVALLVSKSGTLSSGMITKKAGISASSWAKIKLNMIDQDLLVCTHKRDMSEGRVIGSVEVKLTKKGTLVAQNLLMIAGLLGKEIPNGERPTNQLQGVAMTVPVSMVSTF